MRMLPRTKIVLTVTLTLILAFAGAIVWGFVVFGSGPDEMPFIYQYR